MLCIKMVIVHLPVAYEELQTFSCRLGIGHNICNLFMLRGRLWKGMTHHAENHAVVSGTLCVTDNSRLMGTHMILECKLWRRHILACDFPYNICSEFLFAWFFNVNRKIFHKTTIVLLLFP